MRAYASGLVLIATFHCVAQNSWGTQQITSEDGLPQNSVISLAMDTLDYLWLATEGGLVRYGGQDFRRFDLPGAGLPRSERMRSIITSPTGEMLVTDASNNLYAVHAHHVVFPVVLDALDGQMHYGGFTDMDTYLRKADRTRPFPGRERWQHLRNIELPWDTHQWAAVGDQELFVYHDSALVREVPLPQPPLGFVQFGKLIFAIGRSGTAHGLLRNGIQFDPATVEHWPANINTQISDYTKIFWRTGDKAAVLLANNRFYLIRPLPDGSGLRVAPLPLQAPTDCHVNDALWSERHQMLVVATDVRGAFIHRPHPMRVRRMAASAPQVSNIFYAQVPLGGDSILALNSTTDLVVLTGDTSLSTAAVRDHLSRTAGVRLADGRVAFVSGRAIETFDPRTGEQTEWVGSIDQPTCLRLIGDTLWVGSLSTLGRVIHDHYELLLRLPDAYCADGIHAIRRLSDGTMALATAAGLFKLRKDNRTLEPVEALVGMSPRTLEEHDGLLFAGTYGNGPYLVVGDSVRPFPPDKRGYLSHTHAFMRDRTGHLWMSTNHGLFRCPWSDLLAWVADPAKTFGYDHYGSWAGIKNPEFNGGCDPSWLMLPNGNASFPTMDGLVQFNPDSIEGTRKWGQVLIESYTVNGTYARHGDSNHHPAGTREVSVTFSVSYWGDPLGLDLEYRLHETDVWRKLDPEQRTIRISDPQPGQYGVEVRMVGAAMDTSAYHSIYFSIERPFLRTPWGIALIVLAGSIFLYVLFRFGSAQLERRNLALERAVAERTESLHHANSELQRSVALKERLISIVTHDIVSPLRFIAQVARKTEAAGAVRSLESGDALREIHFAAEKQHGNAQNLLSWIKQQEGVITPQPRHVVMNMLIEDLFDRVRSEAASKGLSLENDVELDDVLMVDKDLLTIALNNLLINAVTYTERGIVRISAATVDGLYHLIIKDTGPGFSPKTREQIERIRKGDHREPADGQGDGVHGLGYIIVAGVMELLGGDLEVVGEGGNGTTIMLRLPLK